LAKRQHITYEASLSKRGWLDILGHNDVRMTTVESSLELTLEAANIHDVPTISHNPQSNVICERMYQTVSNPPQTEEQAANLVEA
jgi:hypothetical protein